MILWQLHILISLTLTNKNTDEEMVDVHVDHLYVHTYATHDHAHGTTSPGSTELLCHYVFPKSNFKVSSLLQSEKVAYIVVNIPTFSSFPST